MEDGGHGHEHSEDIADEGNPVYKLDVDIPAIRLLGVDRNIKKHPPPKRKLHVGVQTLRERLGSAGGRRGTRAPEV